MRRSASSRYARVDLRPDGLLPLWRPAVIPVAAEDQTHRIAPGEEGRLDVIAAQYYGDGALFWILAIANKIRFVQRDAALGVRIRIPALGTVRQLIDGTLR